MDSESLKTAINAVENYVSEFGARSTKLDAVSKVSAELRNALREIDAERAAEIEKLKSLMSDVVRIVRTSNATGPEIRDLERYGTASLDAAIKVRDTEYRQISDNLSVLGEQARGPALPDSSEASKRIGPLANDKRETFEISVPIFTAHANDIFR